MKISTVTAAGALALACTAPAAMAGMSETYMGSFALATTNWDENFDIPGFDSMGGTRTLDSVTIMLTGEVEGDASAESLDASPATITLDLQATLQLELFASGTVLAEVIPVANASFNATAFDGTIDFDGTSGTALAGLSGSAMEMETITDAMILANFVDVMTVALAADADGTSTGSGAGNLITQFATEAGLSWKVTYNYTPAPAGLAAFGIAGLAGIRRRR